MERLPAALCTFRLDGMRFGVDVERVQEVLRQQRTTRVPLAPEALAGLLNLRGRIVAAIDLRRRLALPERAEGNDCVNVIVATKTGAVSLVADEIADVLTVDPSNFERAPATLQGPARELICGACKLPEELVLLLDVERVLQVGAVETAR